MNTQKFLEVLGRVFLEVLEQHAFLMPEPPADGFNEVFPYSPEEVCLEIEMDVMGDISGMFVFLLPRSLSNEIESNLAGELSSASKASLDGDSAKELLNIIGATAINEALGLATKYDISIPRANTFEKNSWARLKNSPVRLQLMVDNMPLYLFFDEKAGE